jgi:hypothetical protein
LIVIFLGLLCRPAAAQAPATPAAPAASGTVVLDGAGVWRMYEVLEPPVARMDGGVLKPLLLKAPWADRKTPPPPAEWFAPGFDDHRWARGPVRLASATPYLSRLCLRGKFTVVDPSRVGVLKLSTAYRGGVIVYVNGQEVARGNMVQAAAGPVAAPGTAKPQAASGPTTGSGQASSGQGEGIAKPQAEDYPSEPFLGKEGKLLTYQEARWSAPANDPRPKALRRELSDVSIPAKLLRAGVNVIAIEIVRGAYPKVVDEKKDPKATFWNLPWDTCMALSVRLSAPSAEGLVPNAARPAEMQVWNSSLLACDYDIDFGDRAEKVFPIEIAATRNGVFSGKVVVGSAKAIGGLKAVASDLTLAAPGGAASPGGKGPTPATVSAPPAAGPAPLGAGAAAVIPAGQITVRYGLPWGSDFLTGPYDSYPFPVEASQLGCLAAAAPDEIPVRVKKAPWRPSPEPAGAPVVPGAVAPIWVTVRVPKDAKAGLYRGTLAIDARGEKQVVVPIEVKVADWALPESQDFRTAVEIIQSPDTLAMQYEVPLWSDRHWELIGESFKLLRDSGNRMVYVPLIAETNFGHEQSMVKWAKKADGSYDYDFTVMDKYLELAEKNMGKPRLVVFLAWDVYMLQKGKGGSGANQQEQGELIKGLEAAGALQGKGPLVTLAGPAGGKTENVELPHYGDPAGAKLWKPLFDQLRQRLAKHGLDKAIALGMCTDAWPTKEEVTFLAEVCPGAGWVVHSHMPAGPAVYGSKTAHQIAVWGIGTAADKSALGWKNPANPCRYFRQGDFDSFPATQWRNLCEFAITAGQRGIGRLGAEFWPVVKDKAGQRKGRIYARYPQSNWRNLDLYTSLLSAGPKGPSATQHYQNFVEGVEACEARIAIEAALSEPSQKARLGADLAQRCQDALDERMRCVQTGFSQLINYLNGDGGVLSSTGGPAVASHYWWIGSSWQDRDARLFDLAGEVAKKIDGK